MSIFDDALEKRFAEAPLIASIEVTSNDTLLIRDLETGAIMRIPVSVLTSAFSGSFASLVAGKVPASQLPSYVDDVLEYADLASFPTSGETGKIYVDLETNKTYRWSGSAYVEISASLALGETSSAAYRGDRGKTAYDHSQVSGNPHGTTKSEVGLSNVDNTSDTNKPVSTAQQTALDGKADKASPSFTGTVEIQDGLISSTKQTTISALNTPVILTPPCSGILRIRDSTLGGAALYLVDANGGVTTISNQTSNIQILFDESYNLCAQVTAGTVPRVLAWSFFGGL